jgi:MSHA biogenesis protein MshJ
MGALKPWLSRFDRMSLRERVLLVAAAAVVLYFLLSLAVIGPDEAKRKARKQRVEAQTVELESVRKEIRELTVLLERDPNAQQRAELQRIRGTIVEADALLAQLDSAAPQAAGAVLREMLGTTPGLELVSFKTLPVVLAYQSRPLPAAAAKPAADAKAAAPGTDTAARPPRSIYRHGIEISIKGNYLALLPYLERLQKYPGRIYWTDVDLSVRSYPDAVLKLTVYTLSGQPTPRIG